jgi:hypothetical protein
MMIVALPPTFGAALALLELPLGDDDDFDPDDPPHAAARATTAPIAKSLSHTELRKERVTLSPSTVPESRHTRAKQPRVLGSD